MKTAVQAVAAAALVAAGMLFASLPASASGDAGGIYGDANPHNQPHRTWEQNNQRRTYGYSSGYRQPGYGYRQQDYGYQQPGYGYQQPGHGYGYQQPRQRHRGGWGGNSTWGNQ